MIPPMILTHETEYINVVCRSIALQGIKFTFDIRFSILFEIIHRNMEALVIERKQHPFNLQLILSDAKESYSNNYITTCTRLVLQHPSPIKINGLFWFCCLQLLFLLNV